MPLIPRHKRRARGALVSVVALVGTAGATGACAGTPPPPASAPAAPPGDGHGEHPHGEHHHGEHPHGEHHHGEHPHGDGHDPLVHRFQNAEQWAREFDDPARDEWQRPAEVIARMAITPGMAVADIGAGTGYFEPWLARAVGPSGTVAALDIEPDMVRYLGERAKREQLDNVRPALSGLDDPGLPAQSVDRILVVDTWHHIPGRETYAAKVREALKSGGKIFVVDFKLDAKRGPPPQLRLAAEQVARELASAGLTVAIVAAPLPDQYVVSGTRP